MKKKMIATLLATVMAIGAMACGNEAVNSSESTEKVSETTESKETEVVVEEPKDPVTITYYFRNTVGEQQYTAQVEEKLNEILKGIEGYEHISIDLVPCEKDYKTAMTLAQSTGAQIDLVSTYNLDFVSMVNDGDFIVLDDLLAEYPEVVSEVPEWLVDMGKINGEQYMIPTYQQAVNLRYYAIPDEYLAMYTEAKKVTNEDVRALIQTGTAEEQLDFWEDLVTIVREKTGSKTKWLMTNDRWPELISNVEYIQKDGGNMLLREGADAPEYWVYTEDYKMIMQRYNEWFKAGLIPMDYATTTASLKGDDFLNADSQVLDTPKNTASEEYVAEVYSTKVPVTVFQTKDHAYIPSQYAAGGNAIYADSENPEECMMIIELLMTKKGEEFYNTLVYGLEGIHYVWEDKDNNRIKTLEYDGSQGNSSCTYHAMKWNTGNTLNAWKNQAVLDGFLEYIDEHIHNGEDTVASPVTGITWDLSSVENQVAQCQAVDAEYKDVLVSAKDFDTTYNEYMKKLEAAGVKDIIDCLSKQYNDFLASK